MYGTTLSVVARVSPHSKELLPPYDPTRLIPPTILRPASSPTPPTSLSCNSRSAVMARGRERTHGGSVGTRPGRASRGPPNPSPIGWAGVARGRALVFTHRAIGLPRTEDQWTAAEGLLSWRRHVSCASVPRHTSSRQQHERGWDIDRLSHTTSRIDGR